MEARNPSAIKNMVSGERITSHITSVQHKESQEREFGENADDHSKRGHFGWKKLFGIDVPHIWRLRKQDGEKIEMLSVRVMHDELLRCGYTLQHLQLANKFHTLKQYFATPSEAALLNEINGHCEGKYGSTPFKLSDALAKMEDVKKFCGHVKQFSELQKQQNLSRQEDGLLWVKLDQFTVAPMVKRPHGAYILSMCINTHPDLQRIQQVPVFLTQSECQQLSKVCSAVGISSTFSPQTATFAVAVDDIRKIVPVYCYERSQMGKVISDLRSFLQGTEETDQRELASPDSGLAPSPLNMTRISPTQPQTKGSMSRPLSFSDYLLNLSGNVNTNEFAKVSYANSNYTRIAGQGVLPPDQTFPTVNPMSVPASMCMNTVTQKQPNPQLSLKKAHEYSVPYSQHSKACNFTNRSSSELESLGGSGINHMQSQQSNINKASGPVSSSQVMYGNHNRPNVSSSSAPPKPVGITASISSPIERMSKMSPRVSSSMDCSLARAKPAKDIMSSVSNVTRMASSSLTSSVSSDETFTASSNPLIRNLLRDCLSDNKNTRHLEKVDKVKPLMASYSSKPPLVLLDDADIEVIPAADDADLSVIQVSSKRAHISSQKHPITKMSDSDTNMSKATEVKQDVLVHRNSSTRLIGTESLKNCKVLLKRLECQDGGSEPICLQNDEEITMKRQLSDINVSSKKQKTIPSDTQIKSVQKTTSESLEKKVTQEVPPPTCDKQLHAEGKVHQENGENKVCHVNSLCLNSKESNTAKSCEPVRGTAEDEGYQQRERESRTGNVSKNNCIGSVGSTPLCTAPFFVRTFKIDQETIAAVNLKAYDNRQTQDIAIPVEVLWLSLKHASFPGVSTQTLQKVLDKLQVSCVDLLLEQVNAVEAQLGRPEFGYTGKAIVFQSLTRNFSKIRKLLKEATL